MKAQLKELLKELEASMIESKDRAGKASAGDRLGHYEDGRADALSHAIWELKAILAENEENSK